MSEEIEIIELWQDGAEKSFVSLDEYLRVEKKVLDLVKERDSALKSRDAWEEKAGVYREVAQWKVAKMERMKGPRPFSAYDDSAFYNEVDAEAARILEKRNGKK